MQNESCFVALVHSLASKVCLHAQPMQIDLYHSSRTFGKMLSIFDVKGFGYKECTQIVQKCFFVCINMNLENGKGLLHCDEAELWLKEYFLKFL